MVLGLLRCPVLTGGVEDFMEDTKQDTSGGVREVIRVDTREDSKLVMPPDTREAMEAVVTDRVEVEEHTEGPGEDSEVEAAMVEVGAMAMADEEER